MNIAEMIASGSGEREEPADKTVRIDPDSGGEASGAAEEDGAVRTSVGSLYSIQAKIGGGGMGVVYLAKDTRLGRYVALKRLNAQSNADPELRRRFLNEAKAAASLNHIHIVLNALSADVNNDFCVIFLEEFEISFDKSLYSGILKSD